MPDAHDSPEYRLFRKLQIYGEAVREAVAGGAGPGGEIGSVRRFALDGLREDLALSPKAAQAMETKLVRS